MTRASAIGATIFGCLAAAAGTAASPSPSPQRQPPPRPTATPRPSRIAGIRAPRRPLEPGDRISLDLKDADLRDVLRSFGQLARLNLVIDPEVHGSVTVRLRDVRWEDALDVILRSNGLASVQEDTMVRVGTPARLAPEPDR